MPDSKDKKSKWGLSNMLHKERPSAATDSTYGSEGDSSTRDSYASAPSLTGSDRSQQPNTFTNDQGQTVTTTTTTTTTTTRGAGGQSQTSGPHTSNMANKLDPRVNSGSDQTEVTEVRRERDRPNVPVKSAMRERSPNPPPQQTRQAPPIQTPARNDPSQNHGDPSSPSGRHNFSYPSRTPPNGQVGAPQGYQQPHQSQQQPGTLQNLKTAAVGIHVSGGPQLHTLKQMLIR